ILKEYIPYKDYFDPNFLLDSFIQRTKDGFLYYRGIDDVVYSFSLEGNLTETINMNFGEKKVPYEFRSDLMTFLNDEEKHYQYLIYAPVKVGNYLAAVVKAQHVRTHFIYNEKDQSIYKNSEIKVGDLFYPQFNVNDSTFISILQESIHTEFESDPMLTEAQKKLLEEGGTIICKYTIKTE
ncbi:MAG: hypothetical protein LIO65_00545, partial [Odoribacter sp.]|nr:hypothetical protein [Odoribacter sp.]